METLDRGEALLQEQKLEQQRMLLLETMVPSEIVQESDLLEQSLSALRVSLKAEKLEAELEAALEARDAANAENDLLNRQMAILCDRMQLVRLTKFVYCLFHESLAAVLVSFSVFVARTGTIRDSFIVDNVSDIFVLIAFLF